MLAEDDEIRESKSLLTLNESTIWGLPYNSAAVINNCLLNTQYHKHVPHHRKFPF